MVNEFNRIVDRSKVLRLRLPEAGGLENPLAGLSIIFQNVATLGTTKDGNAAAAQIVLQASTLAAIHQESPGAVEVLPPVLFFWNEAFADFLMTMVWDPHQDFVFFDVLQVERDVEHLAVSGDNEEFHDGMISPPALLPAFPVLA